VTVVVGAVRSVQENKLYGYKWVEEDDGEPESWCRVIVSSISTARGGAGSSKKALVYFPDYGNTMEVGLKELLVLPSQFYQLPFQVGGTDGRGYVSLPHGWGRWEELSARDDRWWIEHVLIIYCHYSTPLGLCEWWYSEVSLLGHSFIYSSYLASLICCPTYLDLYSLLTPQTEFDPLPTTGSALLSARLWGCG